MTSDDGAVADERFARIDSAERTIPTATSGSRRSPTPRDSFATNAIATTGAGVATGLATGRSPESRAADKRSPIAAIVATERRKMIESAEPS
jgi:hypothetical protein